MSKRMKFNEELYDDQKTYSLPEAVQIIKQFKPVNFDATIELVLNLGVDPRHSDQMVRGSVVLPHGLGKEIIVAVIAEGDKALEAKNAGANMVGSDDIIEKIQEGSFLFDRCIATPDMMSKLSKVARILGPRGLMPNPKLGTVTTDVTSAIENARKGQVDFRVDKAGVIHAPVGKVSFGENAIIENYKSLADTIFKLKPAAVKNSYLKSAFISGTMLPSIKVNVTAGA